MKPAQVPDPADPLDTLDRISNGFLQAKILLAGAELRLFDQLRTPGVTAPEVAGKLGAPLRGVEILLDALTAMGIVIKEGGRYRNDPGYEPHLTEDGASHFVAMLRHRNHLFRGWAELENVVRGTAPVTGDFAHRPQMAEPGANENFIRAMYAVGHRQAPAVVERVPLEGVRRVADFGGGPGHYLEAFLRRAPGIEAYLVDLPLTLETARKVLAGSPFRDAIRFVAWDLYEDPAPAGLPPFDLVWLSQVVHSDSAERNRALFRKIYGSLAPGGLLVVRENTVDEDRSKPPAGALFAVNMLAMTPGGRTYTEAEIAGWGRDAGLVHEGGERVEERSHLIFLRRPR